MSAPVPTSFSLLSPSSPEQASIGLRRKDSRHVMNTCHGVTSSGRACRRAIKSVNQKYSIDGTMLTLHAYQDAACFFCWQHKEQADQLVQSSDKVEVTGRKNSELASQKYSIAEAQEHVGQSAVVGNRGHPPQDGPTNAGRPVAKESRSGQLVGSNSHKSKARRQSAAQTGSFLSILMACLSSTGTPRDVPARPKPRPCHHQTAISHMPENGRKKCAADRPKPDDLAARRNGRSRDISPAGLAKQSGLPEFARDPSRLEHDMRSSHQYADGYDGTTRRKATALKVHRDRGVASSGLIGSKRTQSVTSDFPGGPREYKAMAMRPKSSPYPNRSSLHDWPPALPRPASDTMRISYAKLLTCMSEKSTGRKDEGYIYMFWQTQLPLAAAEALAAVNAVGGQALSREVARSDTQILHRRPPQTSVTTLAAGQAQDARTICLKIGRAANVHQRMGQWRKQCGYNISLLKYYPQLDDDHGTLAKIPCVAKIERLVHLHLEMLGYRVKKECRCGTEHREWFEIQATHNALHEVDGIIRKWISWYTDCCAES